MRFKNVVRIDKSGTVRTIMKINVVWKTNTDKEVVG